MNIAECIPYESFKEKIKIVSEELNKKRYVEIWDKTKVIYSAQRFSQEGEGHGCI